MNITRTLASLKSKDLKRLAFLTGSPVASTKTELTKNLATRLHQPLINGPICRVLSVDMGIRNLAYCVLDAKEDAEHKHESRIEDGDGTASTRRVVINHWQKLDLLDQIRKSPSRSEAADHSIQHGTQDEATQQESSTGLFTPPIISEIALSFTQLILSHKPSTILIERQRFRSGGGSAIQEWTIRVNMLESMLWACLTTLRSLSTLQDQTFPAVHSVEPARVAKFWHEIQDFPASIQLESDSSSDKVDGTVDSTKRLKITKAQRMATLRRWITDRSEGLLPLDFDGQAEETVKAFASTRSRDKLESHPGKLDDLTDCLMQGAAWIRWEANTQAINALLLDRQAY